MIDKPLDYWILRQLRGAVLTDVKAFIPDGYFDSNFELAPANEAIKGSARLSYEIEWGRRAYDLARPQHFGSMDLMTARQVAAFEVMIHLGLLTSTEAAAKLHEIGGLKQKNEDSGDRNQEQFINNWKQGLPTLRLNLLEGLRQYTLHMSDGESKPFLSLTQNSPLAPIYIF